MNPEKAVLKALIAVACQEATGREATLSRNCIEQHIQKYRKTIQSELGGVDDELQALVSEVISDAASGTELAEHDTWDRAGALFGAGLKAAEAAYGNTQELPLRQYHAAKAAMEGLLRGWQD